MTALLRPTGGHRPRTADDGGARPPLRVLERGAHLPGRQPVNRRRLGVLGGALLFAGVLAGNVAVQAQTTQGQFELERLEAKARRRQAGYQQLRLELAQLEAPQRVVEHARQLGMVEPSTVTYLTPTAKTSAPGLASRPEGDAVSTAEAAQGWANVKPHLDSRR